MKTPPWIKLLAVLSLISSIIGLVFIFKIPGNVALVPLSVGLMLCLSAFIAAKIKKVKCYLVYLVLLLSLGGIIYLQVGKETSEVIEDEVQEQQLEEHSKSIEESEELDDLLDE